jgi:UPF0716 protein FxsA
MILFSGALLLTPGFFTDAVGFALLIPAVRAAVLRYLRKRIKVQSFAHGPAPHRPDGSDTVIDATYTVEADDTRPRGPSGWTQH